MNSDAARHVDKAVDKAVAKAAIAYFHGHETGGSLSLTNVSSTEFQPRLNVKTMSVAVCAHAGE